MAVKWKQAPDAIRSVAARRNLFEQQTSQRLRGHHLAIRDLVRGLMLDRLPIDPEAQPASLLPSLVIKLTTDIRSSDSEQSACSLILKSRYSAI